MADKSIRVDFPQKFRKPELDYTNLESVRDFFIRNEGKLALIHDREHYPDGLYTLIRIGKEKVSEYLNAQLFRNGALSSCQIFYRHIDNILIAGEMIGFSQRIELAN